ncbi:hypothetical protein [Lacrimispora sp.]|uniref:hypothetical protein n=1 Tax=Lacrimispora sp. TaxID=2719234 RepID=UPI0028AD0619|nr:hypothetical protein [Lacrimispora sp.]
MEEMELVVTQENDVEVKPEPSRWYEGHISLEDAKTFIKSNIATAARSFIAIGFYLKCVRDRELFVEEDYQDVWEFAKTEYGISKSTASRYMSMNDRFSEGGNSPNIRDEYRAFGKSQLQEMLYLEDEQLEQVRPGDRVEDIRSLRKPKEVPYIELPGQMEIEIDFPDALPLDQFQTPLISQKQTFEMNVEDMLSNEQESVAISQQEPVPEGTLMAQSWEELEEKRKEEWLIRCEVLKEMCDSLCNMHSYSLEKDRYSTIAIQRISSGSYGFGFGDDGTGHSRYNADYKNSQYYVEEFNGDKGWVFESGEIEQHIWNFNGRKWHKEHPDEQEQEIPPQENPGFYNPDDDSKVDESYSLAGIPRASDRHVTMLARLFVQERKARLIYGGEAFGITDERIVDMLRLFYNSQKPIIIDNDVEVSVAAEIIEFSRGDEDLGICLFQKFSNYVRKQIDEFIKDRLEEAKVEENQEKVIVQPGSVPESSETIIDGEYEEVPPEQELSARSILEEEKAELHNWIKAFQEEGLEMPPMVRRQKIIVAALAAMVSELEAVEPESLKQEQPELPILKNNDQRKEFIDAYETWPIWIDQKEIGERYYRYDLSDKVSMVVKVSWKHTWSSYKESKDYGYGAEQYYLLGVKSEWSANTRSVYVEDETRTFYECSTNMTALVEYLKEFQKKK